MMTNLVEKQKQNEQLLLPIYFTLGFFEIIAEYFNNKAFMYGLKPLLIPILILLYWKNSIRKNSYFLTALFFIFLANIFFISKDFNSIMIASVFFIMHRAIIIYLVVHRVKVRSFLPVFLGCIPFVAIFSYLTFLTKNELGSGIYIYCVQVLFLIFLGGFALSNYMVDDSKKNFWLLVNAMFFAIIQFILVLKLFYISINIFQPISMALYIIAQYAIYKFMLMTENVN